MENPFESSGWLAGFSIFASGVFMTTSSIRLWFLRNSRLIISPGLQAYTKALLTILFVVANVATFIQASRREENLSSLEIASFALCIVSGVMLIPLSWVEHRRSWRPSDLAVIYTLMRFIRDGIMLSHFSVRGTHWKLRTPIVVQMILTAAVLVAESVRKDNFRVSPMEKPSLEETSSLLSRGFLAWVISIVVEGYRGVLVRSDLGPLDPGLSANVIRTAILQTWDRRKQPESRLTLIRALAKFLWISLLLAAPFRFCLLVFRYGQPLLIHEMINYLGDPTIIEARVSGRMILIVAVFIFIGQTATTAVYRHYLNRMRIMIKDALMILIHQKILDSRADLSPRARIERLCGKDVERLQDLAETIHESWAQSIEIIFGFIILAKNIGWLWPMPLVVVFLCSRVSLYLARRIRFYQRSLDVGSEVRVTLESSVADNIRNVKLLGLQKDIMTSIHELRRREVRYAGKIRWAKTMRYAFDKASAVLAPTLTFVCYAATTKAKGEDLDIATLFAVLAVLSLLSSPIYTVMTLYSKMSSHLVGARKIQEFLLEPPRLDNRVLLSDHPMFGGASEASSEALDDSNTPAMDHKPAIVVNNLSVEDQLPPLRDIHLTTNRGSVNMFSGASASEVGMFALSLLGETTNSTGLVSLATKRIGYCSKTPWISNGTVKDTIQKFADKIPHNSDWYADVISACGLSEDIEALPAGDSTLVGSRGMRLCKALHQKLALARAVYSRSEIIILDDAVDAVDEKSQCRIITNLVGPDGLLRQTNATVLLINNAANTKRCLELADDVIVFSGGQIEEQGKWDEIKSRTDDIPDLPRTGLGEFSKETASAESSKGSDFERASYGSLPTELGATDGSSKLFRYLTEAAGEGEFVFTLCCAIISSFFAVFPIYWVKIWMDSGLGDIPYYLGGFVISVFIGWFAACVFVGCIFLRIAPITGLVLHSRLLDIFSRYPLSYFEDLWAVDTELPPAMSATIEYASQSLILFILFYVNQSYLLPTLPFVLIIAYFLERASLRSLRQLRRLGLDPSAALHAKMVDAIEGLVTIRAFDGQEAAKESYLRGLDAINRPFYLTLCVERWLSIVFDGLLSCVGIGVVIIAVILKDPASQTFVGVTLNILIFFHTTLLRLVSSWVKFNASLDSVAKLRGLEADVTSEDEPWRQQAVPPEHWPTSGTLEITKLTASTESGSEVLRDVSLQVEQGQKVVICGGPDSGSDSVMDGLLCLLNIKQGFITVDGADISRVPRALVRERCFVTIPRTPMLFPHSSVRFNLDPTESLSNDTLLDVLARVKLWQQISRAASPVSRQDFAATAQQQRPQPSGGSDFTHPLLDARVDSLPDLSVGQVQLVALARALLQLHRFDGAGLKPIVLLDDLAAVSDPESSDGLLVQDVIREEFMKTEEATVILFAQGADVDADAEDLQGAVDFVVRMADGECRHVGPVGEQHRRVQQELVDTTTTAASEGGA